MQQCCENKLKKVGEIFGSMRYTAYLSIINSTIMAKVKCYSVRLETLTSISPKCYKATAFDGSTAFIPKSQVFGQDYEVQKSDAYWIASWFLDKEDVNLQFSSKKVGWFDKETGRQLPTYTIEKHVPEQKIPVNTNLVPELLK